MRFYESTTRNGHTTGTSYGPGWLLMKFLLFLAVIASPIWLWEQGHIWGQFLGVVAGVVVWGSTVAYFLAKLVKR